MKVANKTIMVTGGGNGMGRELVIALLQKGARVAAVDVNETFLNQTGLLAGALQKNLSLHVLDITNTNAVYQLPDEVIKIHGTIDGIINNAGVIQPFVKVKDLKTEDITRVFNINFYATLHVTKAFLPFLLNQPEAHIVNVSSMGGFLPVPGQAIYGASKAAVKLLTEALYTELLNTNVKVTIVFPGAIATNIATNSGVSVNIKETDKNKSNFKMLPPDKAASIIIHAIETNKYRVLVGSDAKFMDFICRLHPKFAANFIYKQMKSLLAG